MGELLVSDLSSGARPAGALVWWCCFAAGLLTIGALAYLVRNPDGSIFTSNPEIARRNTATIRSRSLKAIALAPVIGAGAIATWSGWGWLAFAGALTGFGGGFVALSAVGWWRLRHANRPIHGAGKR
jgi:hypothetical protein